MRPYVSVVVVEGGLGALIARSIPGRDASYVKGLAAFNSYCDLQGIAPPTSGRKQYEYINDSGEPVVADDAAVSITAGYATRVALDILDEADLDKEAWLLTGYRKGWVFERQGHSIALDVGEPDKVAAGHDAEAFEFAKRLVEEMRNATPAS